MKQYMRNKSGASPIISVIMVAISIGITLPASYWVQGIIVTHIGSDKVVIETIYVTKSGGTYTVNLKYINSGNAETSIVEVYLNGISPSDYSPPAKFGGSFSALPSLCEVGATKVGMISFTQGTQDQSGNQLNAGVTVIVSVVTSSGMQYSSMVMLP